MGSTLHCSQMVAPTPTK
nr:unnamed protein product [Callosobruchus chinensis]